MCNILFITGTHSHGGGAEAVLADLVNHLDSSKYSITIQEVMHYHVKKTITAPYVKIRSCAMLDTKLPLKVFNALNIYLIANNPRVLVSLFGLDGYDIVIAWNGEKSANLMYKVVARHHVAWFHSSIEDLNIKKYPKMKERNERLCRAYGKAERIVTISRLSLASLKEVFPQYIDKALIIHNMCDIESIRLNASAQLGEENGALLKGEGKHIIALGRLEKRKNFTLLIDAVRLLTDDGFTVHLHILGSGAEEETLRQRAVSEGVQDRVHLLGFIENPMPYIAKSDVLCLSSTNEGWGLVAVEAMVLGKPFVTTPVAGASDELSDGGRCGLVAGYDARDYADKIKTLLTDSALCKKMGEAGQEKAKEYTPEATVSAFEKMITDVMKSGSGEERIKARGGHPLIAMAEYMFYSLFDAARIVQCIGFLRKAGEQDTLYGKKVPRFVRFFVGGAALLCTAAAVPLLLPIRLICTVLYLSYITLLKTAVKE